MFIASAEQEPFNTVRDQICEARESITIFSPYVKRRALESLLPKQLPATTLVTSLRPIDLWTGASDLEVYEFCRSRQISIYLSERLHLKAYVVDWRDLIFGSSNLTSRGLGVARQHNYELNSMAEVDPILEVYLRRIISGSVLMDDVIYEQLKDLVFGLDPLPDLSFDIHPKKLLISQLPMTESVDLLYELYARNFMDVGATERACALHDVALFNIPFGLGWDEFLTTLKREFFVSPFLQKLTEFIDNKEHRFFGEVKAWIQNTCEDVPVPSRRDLTGNIQVLYSWLAQLSEGRYEVDRPNHSERIRNIGV